METAKLLGILIWLENYIALQFGILGGACEARVCRGGGCSLIFLEIFALFW